MAFIVCESLEQLFRVLEVGLFQQDFRAEEYYFPVVFVSNKVKESLSVLSHYFCQKFPATVELDVQIFRMYLECIFQYF